MKKVFRVIYYLSPSGDNPVKEFLDSLENIQKAKIFRIFQAYEFYGLSSIIPHTKKLTGTPLWEISVRGRDNIRVIYILSTKTSILVLHGFVKKTQKTAKKELSLAINRYEDWKKRS